MRRPLVTFLAGVLLGGALAGAWGWQEFHVRAARFLAQQLDMELRAVEGTPVEEWNPAQRNAFLQIDTNFHSLERVMRQFIWQPRGHRTIEQRYEQARALLETAGGPINSESRREDDEDN